MRFGIFAAGLAYLLFSLFAWEIRMMAEGEKCVHRYMDYVFPITKLHCKVGGP